MEDARSFFGQTRKLKGIEAITLFEAGISEAFCGDNDSADRAVRNLFGRWSYLRSLGDLSWLMSMAASGMRSAMIVNQDTLLQQLPVLQECIFRKVPLVIYAIQGNKKGSVLTSDQLTVHLTGKMLPCQWYATSLQDVVDMGLMAHRLSEEALLPVMIAVDPEILEDKTQYVQLPDTRLVKSFLGTSDDLVPSATPVQKMLFGDHRRRLPKWYDHDLPLVSDLPASQQQQSFLMAGLGPYWYQFLPDIIKATYKEFNQQFDRPIDPVRAYKTSDTKHVVLGMGGKNFSSMVRTTDFLRQEDKIKTGCIHLNQWHPKPSDSVREALQGKQYVTILDQLDTGISGSGPIYSWVSQLVQDMKQPPALIQAFYTNALQDDDMQLVFRNMFQTGTPKSAYLTGIPFHTSSTELPTLEVMAQHIERILPDWSHQTLFRPPSLSAGQVKPDLKVPNRIAGLEEKGMPLGSVSRFYRDILLPGSVYGSSPVLADPSSSVAVHPAGTGVFQTVKRHQNKVPVWNPANCTGCGSCMIYCPQAAIPSVVFDLEALFRKALEKAAGRGVSLTPLTPLIRKLASQCHIVLHKASHPITKVNEFLPAAFKLLGENQRWQEEQIQQANLWLQELNDLIGELEVVKSDFFFPDDRLSLHAKQELFKLCIDYSACIACGHCVSVCPEEALSLVDESTELKTQMSDQMAWIEDLPVTPEATISALQQRADYSDLAALMLDKKAYQAYAGDGLGLLHGFEATLHAFFTLLEKKRRSRSVDFATRIGDMVTRLEKGISDRMHAALNPEDLEPWFAAIRQAGDKRIGLTELMAKFDTKRHEELLDTALLRRQMELLQDLKYLLWLIETGPTGRGRTSYSLCWSSDTVGASRYPWHHQHAPTVLGSHGKDAETVLGLIHGQVRHFIDNVRLMRRATLEEKGKYRPEIDAQSIADLSWDDLSDQEKEWMPPLIWITDIHVLSDQRGETLNELLNAKVPLRIICLDTHLQPLPTVSSGQTLDMMIDWYARLLQHRSVYFYQGNMAQADKWVKNVDAGLANLHSTVLHFMKGATSREEEHLDPHNFQRLALSSRAYPHLSRNPEKNTDTASTSMDILDNPDPFEGWPQVDQHQIADVKCTFAHWLFFMDAWKEQFNVNNEVKGTTIDEYLNMDRIARKNATPVIRILGTDEKTQQWVPSELVVRETALRAKFWQRLQTFTIEANAKNGSVEPTDLSETGRQQEIEQLKAKHQQELETIEQEWMLKAKQVLKQKLIELTQKNEVS